MNFSPFPFYGEVLAGSPRTGTSFPFNSKKIWGNTILLPVKDSRQFEGAIAAKLRGNSMEYKKIFDGDIVLFKLDGKVRDEDIVIMEMGNSLLVKVYKKENNLILLEGGKKRGGINSNDVRVVGKVFDVIGSINQFNKKEIIKKLKEINENRRVNKENLTYLEECSRHSDKNIRLLTIKVLGRLKDKSATSILIARLNDERNEKIKKETVSSIGRMRDFTNKKVLFELLNDKNPEVTLQAIRALLVFKQEKEVRDRLSQLCSHKNEIISDFISKEILLETRETKDKHTQSPKNLRNVIVNGDVLRVMKKISDDSIHLTFTSPPYYNARDYSIYASYKEYLGFLKNVFSEICRITKEGRYFIVNTSPIIIPRPSRSHSSKRYPIPYDIHGFMDEIGWEFVDDILWIKNEASVKNRNGGFFQHRKPLMYKPNARTECLMVYRKKSNKLIDWNIQQYSKEVVEDSLVLGEYDTSNVWNIKPSADKNHPAVFPIKLCKNIIKYYSMKGDLVFDPFAGRGTLGKAAKQLGRDYFLVEVISSYIEQVVQYIDDENLKLKNIENL